MIQTIFDNESRKKIEEEIKQLVEDLKDYPFSLSDLIADNPDKYADLARLIFQNQYIRTNYDGDLVLQILEYTYVNQQYTSIGELVSGFENNLLSLVFKDWVAIFPMEYALSGGYTGFKRAFSVDKFKLIPPRHSYRQFNHTFVDFYDSHSVDKDSLEHYQRSRADGDFLTQAPLLSFRVAGSMTLARYRCVEDFKLYYRIQDVFMADYSARKHSLSRLFNEIRLNQSYYLLNLKTGKLERFPLSSGSRVRGQLDGAVIAEFKRKRFSDYVSLVFGAEVSGLRNRIFNALSFFSKGFNQEELVTRFLFYVIAMEALFSRDRYTPLRTTLADCISLLCFQRPERLAKHKLVKDIYDSRSEIVHSGKTDISYEMVEQTEQIAAKALLRGLDMLRECSSSSNPEGTFFGKLLEMKLGC